MLSAFGEKGKVCYSESLSEPSMMFSLALTTSLGFGEDVEKSKVWLHSPRGNRWLCVAGVLTPVLDYRTMISVVNTRWF